jgi:hypothetical protein
VTSGLEKAVEPLTPFWRNVLERFEPWRKYICVENLFPWKLNVKMKSWDLEGAFPSII